LKLDFIIPSENLQISAKILVCAEVLARADEVCTVVVTERIGVKGYCSFKSYLTTPSSSSVGV